MDEGSPRFKKTAAMRCCAQAYSTASLIPPAAHHNHLLRVALAAYLLVRWPPPKPMTPPATFLQLSCKRSASQVQAQVASSQDSFTRSSSPGNTRLALFCILQRPLLTSALLCPAAPADSCKRSTNQAQQQAASSQDSSTHSSSSPAAALAMLNR